MDEGINAENWMDEQMNVKCGDSTNRTMITIPIIPGVTPVLASPVLLLWPDEKYLLLAVKLNIC